MLSNAYFLAKFRFDTAENEPAKNLQKNLQNCHNCRVPLQGRTHLVSPMMAAAAAVTGRLADVRKIGLGLAKLGKLAKFCKFLAGSFSAVSKRNFARKYAFDSIYQALQDLHTFAPLQSQNFNKKISLKNQQFSLQFNNNFANVAQFAKFCQLFNISDR